MADNIIPEKFFDKNIPDNETIDQDIDDAILAAMTHESMIDKWQEEIINNACVGLNKIDKSNYLSNDDLLEDFNEMT